MIIGSKPNLIGALLVTSTIASGPAGMQNGHDDGTAEIRKCLCWSVMSKGSMKPLMRTSWLSSARIRLLNDGIILPSRLMGSTCASVFHDTTPCSSGSNVAPYSAALGRPCSGTFGARAAAGRQAHAKIVTRKTRVKSFISIILSTGLRQRQDGKCAKQEWRLRSRHRDHSKHPVRNLKYRDPCVGVGQVFND